MFVILYVVYHTINQDKSNCSIFSGVPFACRMVMIELVHWSDKMIFLGADRMVIGWEMMGAQPFEFNP